ncbi:MAG: serine hydrolase [Fimbriimonadaceae bacterium]|nr:serine hydrolase [Fimbriimonadaceae bacterium]
MHRLLQRLAASLPLRELAVAVDDRQHDRRAAWHGDRLWHPASTVKVAVLLEALAQVEAGTLRPEPGLLVTNAFPSLADGQPYATAPGDDSDPTLYEQIGQVVPVADLCHRMIARSGNLATNVLLQRLTPAAVNARLAALGIGDVVVRRGMEDKAAYAAGLNNSASAAGLTALLAAIADDRAVSPAACRTMRALLLAQEFNEGIPAGLSADLPVAHKTGWIDGLYHDTAILLPADRRPLVLTVMTAYDGPVAAAHSAVATVAREVAAAWL